MQHQMCMRMLNRSQIFRKSCSRSWTPRQLVSQNAVSVLPSIYSSAINGWPSCERPASYKDAILGWARLARMSRLAMEPLEELSALTAFSR